MAGATTKAEREARRRLVYHRHYVLGRSVDSIAQDDDIDADRATLFRDIKAMESAGFVPGQQWYINNAMERLQHIEDGADWARVMAVLLKVAPVKHEDDDPDLDAWKFDTRGSK